MHMKSSLRFIDQGEEVDGLSMQFTDYSETDSSLPDMVNVIIQQDETESILFKNLSIRYAGECVQLTHILDQVSENGLDIANQHIAYFSV